LNVARSRWLVAGVVAAIVAAAVLIYAWPGARKPPEPPAAAVTAPAQYVGAKACGSCHAKEFEAWRGSHHDLAMQHASDTSVLGDFGGRKFTYAGVTSTFFKRDGKFYVNTDGADGKLRDFEIKYAFGLTPLQQYLVEFPDGRIQALSIAWDSRAKAQGGQRWFHLYPGQAIKAGDRLHWTGIDQNWNHQCAECHSTNLRKNFDATGNTFKTTWSEINVACEACHGPGSNHAAWAKKEGDWQRVPGKGLAVALDERHGAAWVRKEGGDTAERSKPRDTQREIETCARCHARRGQLTDDYLPGRPLADTHRAALLQEGLHWPDGQQRDEVYNYASFLQSEMFGKGVTCSDCHEPHSLKLRAPGNAVCAQCHQPAKFDDAKHTHHAAGTSGAQCAACHMPTTTYMGVDPRHDHSLRIPRPDRSVSMGAPNACNQCHKERSAQWSAEQIRQWSPQPLPGHQGFAEALNAGFRSAAGAREALIAAAGDPRQPAIARASAIALLARYQDARTMAVLRKALDDIDPLVRGAAVEALGGAAPEARAQLLYRMLADPVRSVRIAAARGLVGVPAERANVEQRAALAKGLEEYVAAQRFNADRPEARSNLGALYAEQGNVAQAEAEFRQALAIDPAFVPAAVNLADLFRSRRDETNAEATLRAALKRDPAAAPLHYALGLSLVRQKRLGDAVAELRQAARLAPDQARYAYVYGIALHSSGKKAEGIQALADAHRRFPGDADLLQALATMERDRGKRQAAAGYARKLVALLPDDAQAKALLQELQR
jgi:predicted CXXCH cytochrome family protein